MRTKIKANRIKPKAFKDKEYLSYMHNSDKTCVICGSREIELHHINPADEPRRCDSHIVPLCPQHHRGNFAPHGFDSADFYKDYPKELLLQWAEEFYSEYKEIR